MAALGAAIIVSSLSLGAAAAFMRPRPDLTEYEIGVANAAPTEGYVLHVSGPVERWYSIPLLTAGTGSGFVYEGPAAWTVTVNVSSAIDVFGEDCSYRGHVEGPWGPGRQTLTITPQPAAQAASVPGDRWSANEIDVRNPPCPAP